MSPLCNSNPLTLGSSTKLKPNTLNPNAKPQNPKNYSSNPMNPKLYSLTRMSCALNPYRPGILNPTS